MNFDGSIVTIKGRIFEKDALCIMNLTLNYKTRPEGHMGYFFLNKFHQNQLCINRSVKIYDGKPFG